MAQIKIGDDLADPLFVRAVRHHHDLQVALPVIGHHLIEDFGEQLWALLDGIQTRWPKQHRRISILIQMKFTLQCQLVRTLAVAEILAGEVAIQRVVGCRIVGRIRVRDVQRAVLRDLDRLFGIEGGIEGGASQAGGLELVRVNVLGPALGLRPVVLGQGLTGCGAPIIRHVSRCHG